MRALGPTAALVLLLGVILPASAADGVESDKPKLAPVVTHDLKHDLSPPLFLLRPKSDDEVVASTHEPLTFPKARRTGAWAPARPEAKSVSNGTGVAASRFLAMPPPIMSFDGVSNRNGVAPPDTNGDVGPNHYVQWVNLSYAVWNKQGTLLYGPVQREHDLGRLRRHVRDAQQRRPDRAVRPDRRPLAAQPAGVHRPQRNPASTTSASRYRRPPIRPARGIATISSFRPRC